MHIATANPSRPKGFFWQAHRAITSHPLRSGGHARTPSSFAPDELAPPASRVSATAPADRDYPCPSEQRTDAGRRAFQLKPAPCRSAGLDVLHAAGTPWSLRRDKCLPTLLVVCRYEIPVSCCRTVTAGREDSYFVLSCQPPSVMPSSPAPQSTAIK
jgi:hypothetical protein